MSYIAVTMNHVRAVKAWAEAHGGQATLDLLTFELEVKARNRYFKLHPQFLANVRGRLAHVPRLSGDVVGFIGWLPYQPMRWPALGDKLAFKHLLMQAGQRTPATWSTPGEVQADYIVKQSAGSFGVDMIGPFRRGELPSPERAASLGRRDGRGSVFVEQFVCGRNVKAWFWGARPFHVQLHDYPLVSGDGHRTIRQLAAERLDRSGQDLATYNELPFVTDALAYQQSRFDDVLPLGEQRWLDFRYGRRFAPEAKTEQDDNALPGLSHPERSQVDSAGATMATELAKTLGPPVLYTLDGVLDAAGRIWWLEVNSNPIFAPTGYPLMLETLFGGERQRAPVSSARHGAELMAEAQA